MAKKKDKKRNNQASTPAVPTKSNIEQTAQTHEDKVHEMEDTVKSLNAPEEGAELLGPEKNASEDFERSLDAERYVNRLISLHKKLVASQQKIDIKEKEQEIQKTANDAKENTLKEQEKQLNARDKKLQEQQDRIDRNEYSSVIRDLLERMRESEKEVTQTTMDRIEELAEIQKNALDQLAELGKREIDLQQREANLKLEQELLVKERQDLERERIKNETLQKSQVIDIEDNIRDEYEDRIDALELHEKQLEADIRKKNAENAKYASFINKLQNMAAGMTPEDILKQLEWNISRVVECEKIIDSLPSNEAFHQKALLVDELQAEVETLQQKVNETALAELQERLSRESRFNSEINALNIKINTLEASNKHKDSVLDQMQGVIAQLRGEDEKKNKAFEYATRIDAETKLQQSLDTRKTNDGKTLRDFARYLRSYVYTNNGFKYDEQVIRAFIAGLHMSPLTILEGISGTGKTSLPREIAIAMTAGLNQYEGETHGYPNAAYRLCSIQSGWRDRMDLIGYFNHFDKQYQETEFFKALYIASTPKYANCLFFIILDEMNLSHPEHYFADFLSLLEQDEDQRFVNIEAPAEYLPALINEGGKIKVPANVRFIGTANQDETTLGFAPKTCDRSNMMYIVGHSNKDIPLTKEKMVFSYEWLSDMFKKSEKEYEHLYNKFLDFITSEDIISIFDFIGVGIGHRFKAQAKRFICVYAAAGSNEEQSLYEAADHLISMRLFRGLTNRFDIDESDFKLFKESYEKLFKETFKQSPDKGSQILEKCIKRK